MHTKGRKIVQEIALRLQEARQQTGLSIREMAARLGVSRDGYAKNERGLNILNIDSLKILGQEFEISMDWMLFNRGPMKYKEKGKREQEYEKMVEEVKREEAGKREEAAAVQQEVEELRNRLAEENKKQEKERQERAKALEETPEVRELLEEMRQDPVFYHRLMLNFQEYKSQQKKGDDTGEVRDIIREVPGEKTGDTEGKTGNQRGKYQGGIHG